MLRLSEGPRFSPKAKRRLGMMSVLKIMALTFAAMSVLPWTALAGTTLDSVKARGELRCGVSTGLAGFSNPDSGGRWQGLDVDICRAIAAAMFGDADKVSYTPLTAAQRFTALQSGEIDVLSRNTTLTLSRDASLGLDFGPVVFYDGQGFLVPTDLGVTSALELDGAAVCVQTGTTTELNLADYFRANGMSFDPVVIESFDEANTTFFANRCDAYTADRSALASIRSAIAPVPADYVLLPEVISKEPLAPAFRHGDNEWGDVVTWVVYALVEAEEKGITQANVAQFTDSNDPVIRRLLGVNPGMGEALGLKEGWVVDVIGQVGNYGEIFARNLGPDTPLNLERGLNDLWSRGGLMYAMPAR